MRGRTLLSAVTAGRATFLVAGAALGIGAYGFVATLAPYRSDRVPQPLPVIDVPFVSAAHVSASELETTVPVPDVPQESIGTPDTPSPRLAATRTPNLPAAQPVEAAGTNEDGVTPLDPPTDKPRGIGPIIIDPSLVPTPAPALRRTGTLPSEPTPGPSPTPQPGPQQPGEPGDDDTPTPDEDGPGKGKQNGHDQGKGKQPDKGDSRSNGKNG